MNWGGVDERATDRHRLLPFYVPSDAGPVIRGELVNLRPVDRADAETLWRWFNDPDLMRHWGITAAAVSRTSVQTRTETWLAEEVNLDHPVCFIIDDLEDAPVGLVILSDHQPLLRSAALSLLIGERDRWGQGLGTDALRTIIDTCFAAWNFHRVWVRVEAFNERAQRLYRQFGFAHEGTLRHETFLDGEYQDVLIFGFLASDLDPKEHLT